MEIIFVAMGTLFIIIGILNLIIIHPVPGLFYLLMSLLFFPITDKFIQKRFGFKIHPAIKVFIFVLIMWATLAVGELMEYFEDYI